MTADSQRAGDDVRVLMVIPQYPPPVLGGMERQARELAIALSALGVEVQVLTGRTGADQPASSTDEGVRVLRVPFPQSKWWRFPVSGLAIAAAMLRRRAAFDVVHVHTLSWFGTLAVLVAKLLSKPVLAKLPTGLEWAFRRGSFRFFVFRRCDAIALLSPDVVEQFREIGFPEARIFKITNGVSMDRFAVRRHSEGPAGAGSTVIFVGRLDPEKGLLDLLDVWPDVVGRCEGPVRLSICGDGPQDGELRSRVDELGIGDSVSFKGHVANVQEELAGAEVFVLPSFIEGNSNAVLEAMAMGLPILSTAVGGTPLLVGPEGQPWLFGVHDQPRLRELLIRLLSEPDLRRALGEAMRTRVRDLMTIERIAERYRAAYLRLAAGDREKVGSESSGAFDTMAAEDG